MQIETVISCDDNAWAVILAAGSGTRLAQALDCPKQFLEWHQRPLYWHCALAFSHCACIDGIVLVFPAEFIEAETSRIKRLELAENPGLPIICACGGKRRQDSAVYGVRAVPLSAKKILIHDAARPFVKTNLIWRICRSIESRSPVVIPGIGVKDTIKIISNGKISTLPRNDLLAIQTPQGFAADALRWAQEQDKKFDMTDDASLMEALGFDVKVIGGDPANIKITTPEDLDKLKCDEKTYPCSGFGYDVHRFGKGRPLKLGGVSIPCNFEVIAHSDGDVLLHALTDAVLGCACLGDIGQYFPDSDPAYSNIASAILLDKALELSKKQGISICQADLTIVAQKPRLAPWRDEIRKNVARIIGLPVEHINLKATTEEGLGFTGRQEGIKAYALVNGLRKSH